MGGPSSGARHTAAILLVLAVAGVRFVNVTFNSADNPDLPRFDICHNVSCEWSDALAGGTPGPSAGAGFDKISPT